VTDAEMLDVVEMVLAGPVNKQVAEPNAQFWRRPVSPTPTVAATASSTLDLPIPLTGGEAKAIAASRLHRALPKGAKCRQRSRAALEK
jgi:hypothetical protein